MLPTSKQSYVMVRGETKQPAAPPKQPEPADVKAVPHPLSLVPAQSLLQRARPANRARGRNRRVRRRPDRKGDPPKLPPVYVSQTFSQCLQYVNDATVSGLTITRGQVGMSLGGVGTVLNSTVAGIASSFRINEITAWPPAGGSVDVEWNITGTAEQALGKDSARQKTLPTGITVTGGLVFRPPAGSYSSMWQAANTNTSDVMFQIAATAGTVLQLKIAYTMPVSVGSGVSQSGYAGVTVGSFYYPYLDGPSTHHWKPVAVPTTF